MGRQYAAYLLRLWREKEIGQWRTMLVNAQTDERRHFADLAEAVEFLMRKHSVDLLVEFDSVEPDDSFVSS